MLLGQILFPLTHRLANTHTTMMKSQQTNTLILDRKKSKLLITILKEWGNTDLLAAGIINSWK